jgi:hypothetical protein
MLYDKDLEYVAGNDVALGVTGVALVWVIDGDCLYDIPTWKPYADMFLNHDEVIDVSDQYPDLSGTTVQFKKDGQVIDEVNTSEYFGSILLSNPTVLNLADYPYGRYVQSPHAKFDGEKFIITNRDVSGFLPWHPTHPKVGENN